MVHNILLGPQVRISNYDVFMSLKFVFTLTSRDEMLHTVICYEILQHFIWVLTVC